MYLFAAFFTIKIKTKYSFFIWFILLTLNIISVKFIKNINLILVDLFKYNNSFWDYILILNNNNKSFLFFILLIYFVIKIEKTNISGFYKKPLILVFLFYASNIEILNSVEIIKYNNFINLNLVNGLILIHPVSMYISYVYYIYVLTALKNIKINKLINNLKNINYKILIFSCLALTLGSYWSQQELNWGGWWNWDFVEIIAFLFFIVSVVILHTNIGKNINYIYFVSLKIINYFVLFFFIIRLDLINSIHSFNSFNKNSFNVNILLSLYIVFIFIVVYNNKNKYKNNNNKNNNVVTLLFLLLLFLFNLYIYINVMISFFYNIQFIELTKYLKKIINVIIFLSFIYLIKSKKIVYLFFLVTSNSYIFILYFFINLIIIKIIYNYKNNYKNIWHIFIIIFIIINNFYYNFIYLTNLNLIKSNLNLSNNLNTLDDWKNHLMCLDYYNNNNYLYKINNYYCYNNNILFNNVYNETLLNNILLYLNDCLIYYKIEKTSIIFNFNKLFILFVFTLLITIFSFKKIKII